MSIIFKGGMPGSVRLRDCEILKQITSKHAEDKRLYGAICAAPAVTLLPWGLTRRKQVGFAGFVKFSVVLKCSCILIAKCDVVLHSSFLIMFLS